MLGKVELVAAVVGRLGGGEKTEEEELGGGGAKVERAGMYAVGRGGGGELLVESKWELVGAATELSDFLSRVAGGKVRLDCCRLFSSGCKVQKSGNHIPQGPSNLKKIEVFICFQNYHLEDLFGKRHIFNDLCFVDEFYFDVFVFVFVVDPVRVVAPWLRQDHVNLQQN